MLATYEPGLEINKYLGRKIVIIFLSTSFEHSKEPAHLGGSFECPQH